MLRKLSPIHLLIFTCLFYAIFASTMIHPVNQFVKKHGTSTYGKQGRHILRVWRMATLNAVKPFAEVKDHALFHGRNPGLFKFIAELASRAGAKSPVPLQVFLIFLVILGIISQWLWLREFFNNYAFPIAGCLLILGTHFLTFFGHTIHQHPYNYAFFNFCMLFMVRFIKTNKSKYFLYAWLSYFCLCQNYYMFWVSTFIMMTGLLYISGRKLINKYNIILGIAPVITVGMLLIQVAHMHGNLKDGLAKVEEAAKARMVDSVKGERPHFKKKMNQADWFKYPMTVSSRIERYFYIPGIVFAFLFFWLFKLRKKNKSTLDYRLLYFAIPAGLSWYFIMFQHTAVHIVSGRYSYFLWMLFFGYFIYELGKYLKGSSVKRYMKYSALFVLVYGGYGFGYYNMSTLMANIYRIYDFNQRYSKAVTGDEAERIKLFWNRYAIAYQYLDNEWLSPYKDSLFQLGNDFDVVKIHSDGKRQFMVIRTLTGKRIWKGTRKLYINGKYTEMINPNEYIYNWHYDRFSVIVINTTNKIESVELK